MRSAVEPQKASAFVILRRPDGAILCTSEENGDIGIPGGKWDRQLDGLSWDRLLEREFKEEIGVPLPRTPLSSGHFEWGTARYQIRFQVLDISERDAKAFAAGSVADPSGAVKGIFWAAPSSMAKYGPVRAHVEAALGVLAASRLISREVSQTGRAPRGAPKARRRAKKRQPGAYTLDDVFG